AAGRFAGRHVFVVPVSFVAASNGDVAFVQLLGDPGHCPSRSSYHAHAAKELLCLAIVFGTQMFFVLTRGNSSLFVMPFIKVVTGAIVALRNDNATLFARAAIDEAHFVDAKMRQHLRLLRGLFSHVLSGIFLAASLKFL